MMNKRFLKLTATILCLLLLLAGCGRSTAATLAKKLELGQKYLEELRFEQAVATFEEAITIDPKAWDAYVGLASAYKGLGDLDQAAAAMERGIEEVATESFDIPQEDMDFLAEIYEQYAAELTEQGDAEAAEQVQQKLQELQAGETGNAGESERISTQQKPSEETSTQCRAAFYIALRRRSRRKLKYPYRYRYLRERAFEYGTLFSLPFFV